jgi:hypothetical protein
MVALLFCKEILEVGQLVFEELVLCLESSVFKLQGIELLFDIMQLVHEQLFVSLFLLTILSGSLFVFNQSELFFAFVKFIARSKRCAIV